MRKQWILISYFFIFALLSGSIYSQLITVLGVSSIEAFGVDSGQVASLYLAISLCSIVVTLGFGYFSDLYGHRWFLVCFALVAGAISTHVAAEISTFTKLLHVFVPLYSVAYLCTPQLMAIYRSALDEMPHPENVALYNAIVRCGFALAWIIGPPLGYLLKDRYGVGALFHIISFSYVGIFFYALIGATLIKSKNSNSRGLISSMMSSKATMSQSVLGWQIFILFVAFSFAYSINHGYLINLPLYVTSEIPDVGILIGIVFGVAAAVEIPFMILSGWLAKKVKDRFLVLVGIASGVVLCLLTPLFSNQWWLICVQIFNGIFVGFVAGLGLTVFQDADKGRLGFMSSLYSITMTLGQIIASVILYMNSLYFDVATAFIFLVLSGSLSVMAFWIYIKVGDVKP